jgi:hypothetical protein
MEGCGCCGGACSTVRVFRQEFALEDAIGSHACSLEVNIRVNNGIPLGSPLFLTVFIINHVKTPKVNNSIVDLSTVDAVDGGRWSSAAPGVMHASSSTPSHAAVAAYDAVMLVAHTLHDVLAGSDPTDVEDASTFAQSVRSSV